MQELELGCEHRCRRPSTGKSDFTTIPLLALSALLVNLVFVGCDTRSPASGDPSIESVQPATNSVNSEQVAQPVSYPIRFSDVTQASGVQSTYSSGADGNQFTILESLGGGVAALDYDRDG